jgi:hypothetical protein
MNADPKEVVSENEGCGRLCETDGGAKKKSAKEFEAETIAVGKRPCAGHKRGCRVQLELAADYFPAHYFVASVLENNSQPATRGERH